MSAYNPFVRHLLAGSALCVAAVIPVSAASRGVINNAATPFMPLKTIDFDDCRWTEGFWANEVALCRDVMVPNLGRLMDDPEIIHAYDNFLVAAGLKEGEFRGWSFHDGDFYKYVEALTYIYGLTHDEAIDRRLDEIISVIGKAQRPDGYIHTQNQIGHGIQGFHHESEHPFSSAPEPFEIDGKHEYYNFGHLMTAACVHHRITGKDNFLEIARKAADLLCRKYDESPRVILLAEWNPPHYMGLVELYRTTGEKRYLNLARELVDKRGTIKTRIGRIPGPDHTQKRTPIREETEAVGHAGHGNYLFSGVADVYGETGDKTLFEALERIWTNISTRKMYVTGATGPNHFGISRNKDYVREGYGKNYELPNIPAYNETCANIGNAMFNWRMFLITGDARFADIVETVFYNSAISGISLDGKRFFYTNPLRFLRTHPENTKDGGRRSPFLSVFCCPPNIIRTIAKISSYAYCTSAEGLWVNLYGSNVLETELVDGSKLMLTQRTNYPWDGKIVLTLNEVESRDPFVLKLRIPGWSDGGAVTVNGEAVEGDVKPGSFFEVRRAWSAGDVIELNLPMDARMIEANPHVETTRNQVAIRRGPIVYCLESADLPEGVGIADVIIPRTAVFEPAPAHDLFAGCLALEGTAAVVPDEDWGNQLYRQFTPRRLEKVHLRLIPYFTWSNREIADMTVWMPLDR